MMNRTSKGQSSFELLITLGVFVAFTLPVLFLLLSVTSVGYEDTSKAQADASARSLADAVNFVYSQGANSSKLVLLYVPTNTQALTLANNEVVVTVKLASGDFEGAAPIYAKVSPTSKDIQGRSGLFSVNVKTDADGEVELVAN